MFIYKGIIYALDLAGKLAHLYNSMHAQSPTIHLVSEVPKKGRAQSFCGAVLRKGFWFDTSINYANALGTVRPAHWRGYRAYTKKLRSNQQDHYPHDYLGNVCPRCAESPEVGLDLLANVP